MICSWLYGIGSVRLWQALWIAALPLFMLMPGTAQAATPMIAAGYDHTCALTSGGAVKCWGDNTWGQLGDGSTTNSLTPVAVSGLSSGVIALAAGDIHTCALTSGGAVKCWGINSNGRLGDGSTTSRLTPVDVSGLASGVSAISAGVSHTCAVASGGAVKCWGYNGSGQLGDGSTAQRLTPVAVSDLASGVIALAAGERHTCALTSGGAVKCWGNNSSGKLGDGTNTQRLTPVAVSGLSSGVSALAAGYGHSCALTSGGGVKCWGENSYGKLGDGSFTSRSTPVAVSGLDSGVSALAAGEGHTCALTSGGAVKCWGYNIYGQLGDGSTTYRSTPVAVSGLTSGVSLIAAGWRHTCAATSGGVKCWGYNRNGQLGDASFTYRQLTPAVSGLTSGVSALAAGWEHTCALVSGGAVKCWGYNEYGQLGDGSTTQRSTPVAVSGLSSGVIALAAGDIHTCALTSGGGVKCWGDNLAGQLGDGSTTNRLTPVAVSGLSSGVIAIAAGDGHTCALTSGGAVKCWGSNSFGELGDGSTTTTSRSTPVAVSGLSSGVIALAAGYRHNCAVASGGAAKCWGFNNYGQLGDGSLAYYQSTPVAVSGLASGVSALAAGNSHSCALTSGGAAKCWGHNSSGQLGDGNFTNLSPPVAVSGLSSGVSALVAGNSHTCAVAVDGAAKCWGDNSYGQLGDGSTTVRSTPVAVSGLASGVSALAAGWHHTCALTGGAVKCWGENFDGQMGDGTMGYRPLASLFVVDLSLISGATGQTITFGAAPSVIVGGTGTVSATATSGLAVSFTSSTPGICTISGSTVTAIAAGTCTIAADQAGDASYNAATQVTQSLTIASTPFSISPSSASASAAGLAGNISVTADTGSNWTATSNANWISVTSGSSGSGNGTVVYSVAANTSSSARTGTLTIGGQTFTVTQAGASVASPGTWTALPGASPSRPSLALNAATGKIQMVVRSVSDQLYVGNFNSGGTFEGWNALPGASPSVVAQAWHPVLNKMFMVARAAGDQLYLGTFSSAGSFEGWSALSGASPSPVALAWHATLNKMFMVARAANDQLYLGAFNSAGSFEGWSALSGASPSPVALAWHATLNKMFMVARAANDQLYLGTFSSAGSFEGWSALSGASPSPVALAWHPASSKMVMAVRGADDQLWQGTFSSTSSAFEGWSALSGSSPTPPVLATGQSSLQLVVRSTDDQLWSLLVQ